MEKEKQNYYEPYYPLLVVKKLMKKIVEKTIKAYANEADRYLLKLYHFAGEIDESVFDPIKAKRMKGTKKAVEAIQTTPQDHLLLPNQRKDQTGDPFITLGEISEKEQIAIIQLGFQRNQEGKLSLKEKDIGLNMRVFEKISSIKI